MASLSAPENSVLKVSLLAMRNCAGRMCCTAGPPSPPSLQVCSWNVAAINNNPLEYWTTYDAPAYKILMEAVEDLIEAPGDRDVPLGSFFSTAAVDEMATRMASLGWEGVDEVRALWLSDYSTRPMISGFLKDTTLGSKRFMSMYNNKKVF